MFYNIISKARTLENTCIFPIIDKTTPSGNHFTNEMKVKAWILTSKLEIFYWIQKRLVSHLQLILVFGWYYLLFPSKCSNTCELCSVLNSLIATQLCSLINSVFIRELGQTVNFKLDFSPYVDMLSIFLLTLRTEICHSLILP